MLFLILGLSTILKDEAIPRPKPNPYAIFEKK